MSSSSLAAETSASSMDKNDVTTITSGVGSSIGAGEGGVGEGEGSGVGSVVTGEGVGLKIERDKYVGQDYLHVAYTAPNVEEWISW